MEECCLVLGRAPPHARGRVVHAVRARARALGVLRDVLEPGGKRARAKVVHDPGHAPGGS